MATVTMVSFIVVLLAGIIGAFILTLYVDHKHNVTERIFGSTNQPKRKF